MLLKNTFTTDQIFPLSYNPHLTNNDSKALDIYIEYLNKAFANPRIKNIAITGAFGIGKSSIIRTFDTKRHNIFNKNKKFLYVSLGEYGLTKNKSSLKETDIQQNNTNENNLNLQTDESNILSENQKYLQNIKSIEHRLLLQIYSNFHQKDLPLSGYKLIPEKIKHIKFKSFIFSLIILFSMIITHKDVLNNLIAGWSPEICWFQYIRNIILENNSFLELMIYSFLFFITTCFGGYMFFRLIPKLKLSKVSIKSNNAELDMEEHTSLDYLEQNSMELIYCLGQIGKKIDRTIIFEDMDRLNFQECVEIFTRLREINHMVNCRLSPKKYIRFVFVVNDSVLSKIDSTKFFDYVMPVTPCINEKNSELVFMQNLCAVNNKMKKEFSHEYKKNCLLQSLAKKIHFLRKFSNKGQTEPIDKTCFDLIENNSASGLVHIVSSCLADHRKQFAVLNDYSLLVKIYKKNNGKLSSEKVAEIFAFVTYKYLWPDDYQRLLEGKVNIFSGSDINDLEDLKVREVLNELKSTGKLTLSSLLYIGFREEDVLARFEKSLNSNSKEDITNEIRMLKVEDTNLLYVLLNYCLNNRDSDDERFISIFAETLKLVLRNKYVLKGKYSILEWFFKNRNVKACIESLLLLDELELESFTNLTEVQAHDNAFSVCCDWDEINRFNRFWSEKRLKVFKLVAKKFDRCFSIQVWDETQENKLRDSDIQEELKKVC